MKSRQTAVLLLISLLMFNYCVTGKENEDTESGDTFYEVDVNKVDDRWPIKFGLKFWMGTTKAYRKLFKSLGPVLNTGHWPTIFEVSAAAPAPWHSDDERMDMWVSSIYRIMNISEPMAETSEVFVNNSIEIIGFSLGIPEAYALTHEQKKYRTEKKAEEEGREIDTNAFYYDSLHPELNDDIAKFYAASIDHIASFGAKLSHFEMIDSPAIKGHENLYVSPEEYVHLIKKTREELDARNITSDDLGIMCPGVDEPGQIKPYLKALANDKEAYEKLYALTVHIHDKGGSLMDIQKSAENLKRDLEIIFQLWEPKRVIVSGFRYMGPDEIEIDGMRFYGDITKCYEDSYKKTNHKALKESLCQTPWYAIRMLAGLTIQFSHGLPWVVYNNAADYWWSRSCEGLVDKDDRPKQVLAAFESLLPYLTNETYPITKQWENIDECYISAYKSVQKKMRIIVVVTNFSPKVCERSFSLRGIDLWDIQKSRIVTYNNGTVSVDADKPYRALIMHKTLTYDVYDVEDGTGGGLEIEFDLTVGPYASATAIFDAKAPKGKNKKKQTSKPKKEKTEPDKKEIESKEEKNEHTEL